MIIKIKLNNKNSKMPIMGNHYAMCYDCYASNITVDEKTQKVKVDLGISVELPKNYGMRIIPRSNITKHAYVLNNSFGIVDPKSNNNSN